MDYKYDAFISYRHCELDKFVAENLHKQLEAFKLPRNIAKKEGLKRKKIERVFRDRDELPLASNLEDPIVEALTSSEYLIVICSPRLKESMWCTKEIQTFIEMHGRNRVLAVLIEGEPEDSFPQELLVDDNGNPVEPLAADVRGKNNAEVKKAIKSEILRLLAPMFGLGYDDLKQRHREQQLKRTAGIVSLCGIVGIAFGVVCATSAVRISAQKKQIEEQNKVLAYSQAESLSKEALELHNIDNRYDAIELAYKAMTEYEGVKMPKSPYSEMILAECLSIYDGAYMGQSTSQINTPGILKNMKVSPSGQYVLSVDTLGNIIVWDAETKKSVYELKVSYSIDTFDFIDDDNFFYGTTGTGIAVANISSKSVRTESDGKDIFFETVWDAKVYKDNAHIVLRQATEVDFVDIDTLESEQIYKADQDNMVSKMFVSDKSDYIYITVDTQEDEKFCEVVDPVSKESVAKIPLPTGTVYDAEFGDDCIYILSSDVSFDTANYKTYITAISLLDNTVVYESEKPAMLAMTMDYSKADGKENLLIGSSSELRLIDAKTGETLQYYFKETDTSMTTLASDGDFLLYDENGNCRCIDVSDEHSDLALATIDAHGLVQLESTSYGMVGRRKNDARLIFYGYVMNRDAVEYTDDLAEAVYEGLLGSQATEAAEEKSLEDSTFVNCVAIMEDAGMMAVNYLDDTLRIYDLDSKELLSKTDGVVTSSISYFGKVKDYYIIKMASVGYLIDDEGQIRAKIDSFEGLSKDGKSVVVYGRNMEASPCKIAIPVYTQDEIVKRTKEYLDKFAPN